MPHLSPYFASQSLNRLTLGDSLRRHLDALLKLMEEPEHRVPVAKVHEALFPLNTKASANAALNRLQHEVNEAAEKQGISLRMFTTPGKKVGAENRYVWFEGQAEVPDQRADSELRRIPQGSEVSDQLGFVPPEMLPVVVLLTFNPHETAAVLNCFHPESRRGQMPKTETRSGTTYSLLGVHGGVRVVHCVSKQGEADAQIAASDAIRDWKPKALFGVGIAFGMNEKKQKIGDVLVSETVRGYELARVNADGTLTLRGDKPAASHTLFQRINTLDQTLKANPNACLHWPTLRFGPLLSGSRLVDNLDYRNSLLKLETEAIGGEMEAVGLYKAAEREKIDWIVVKAICDWADGNKDAATKEGDQRLAAANAAHVVHAALTAGGLYAGGGKPISMVAHYRDFEKIPADCRILDPLGKGGTLGKTPSGLAGEGGEAPSQGLLVMEYLHDWAADKAAPPLFALLGEYGMGKTVTCQRLYQELLERRRHDPALPQPFYFDLRRLPVPDRKPPTLAETVEACAQRGWSAEGAGQYSFFTILGWIRHGNALVIFDGLDEVLVKLEEADGHAFTRELLRLHAEAAPGDTLKLLLSCRTHYFRTLRDQQNHFTGQERGSHTAEAYRALTLLPLNEAQISHYITGALPGCNAASVLETLRAVHNLEECAQRPYTLSLVTEFIPQIEAARAAGQAVYGVTLYRHMAQSWLERDAGKHHVKPEHKLALAAHLAAFLWCKGAGVLPVGDIEDWLHAWRASRPVWQNRYAGVSADQLEEDLRTATFLVREDSAAGSGFRFAHTSMMEFFLARYLFEAVEDKAPERWAIQKPSDETLDFLGQLFAEANRPALLHTLHGWCAPYRPEASELLLAYALAARRAGWPTPSLRGADLRGADLAGWIFDGRKAVSPRETGRLDLSGTDFSGAVLRNAVFDQVRLDGVRFTGACLDRAEFLEVDATNADWGEAACTGTLWRASRLAGGQWHGATGTRPRFVECTGWQEDGFQGAVCAPGMGVGGELRWLKGHFSLVSACGFSPDGARLVSGGDDGTLRLWEAASGAELACLRGHEGWVQSCGFSPDGARLVSGGDDGTLRLWEAASGAELACLRGHEDWVQSCGFSPDGSQLVSGGADGTMRLWDAHTGECLRIHAMAGRSHRGFDGHAVWVPSENRLIEACGDIWRWLAWVRPGADGWPERLPLEAFGPLPLPKRLAVGG